MSSVRIVLPDNSTKEFTQEPTVLEVAKAIGPRLANDTLGGFVNGEIVDLRTKLKDGTKLKIITTKDREGLEVIRHSAAHVMAQAVQEIWPEVKVTIGPVVEDGFYYDFDSPHPFTPEDLQKIEIKMKEIIKRDLPIVREDWDVSEAIKTFDKMKENFKVELITELRDLRGEKAVGIYKQGDQWFDLCRGPHVQRTGQIKAVKVMSLAGAYWRGDEKNKQLQRIYATAFNDSKELDEYLHMLEEAKKRDHRKLGKELGLYYFSQLTPGCPFFTGKGAIIYNQLVDYLRSLYPKYGYQEVITPQIYDVEMYKTSGHYENYADNMFFSEAENRTYSMKPMNCPGHCVLYSMEHHSYRDLPLRVADFGRLHRAERGGTLHGLTRVRTMCQDDAHIFCTENQIEAESEKFIQFLNEVYGTLGMNNYSVKLATRPEKRVGSDEVWDRAEKSLAAVLTKMNVEFEYLPGEGAFYGPKIEFHFSDAIKRKWQLGTLQLDFSMPTRFGLKYIGEDNTDHTPVMLHRAILGSLERFIGVYIEHTAGHLPTWLAPTQVQILNVTDRQGDYCQWIASELLTAGVRAHFDSRNEKLGFKIREAQLQKVPYMVIVGDKEVENKTVSLRLSNGSQKEGIAFEDFKQTLLGDIHDRKLKSPYV